MGIVERLPCNPSFGNKPQLSRTALSQAPSGMSNPFDLLDLGTESDEEEPRSRTGSVNITRGRSFSLEDCTGSTAQIIIDNEVAPDDDADDGWVAGYFCALSTCASRSGA